MLNILYMILSVDDIWLFLLSVSWNDAALKYLLKGFPLYIYAFVSLGNIPRNVMVGLHTFYGKTLNSQIVLKAAALLYISACIVWTLTSLHSYSNVLSAFFLLCYHCKWHMFFFFSFFVDNCLFLKTNGCILPCA